MLCFFCVFEPFFLHVSFHLRQVHFCYNRLLCFWVVDSARLILCFPLFPPDIPVSCPLQMLCFDVLILFRSFFCSLPILRHNRMLMLLPLTFLVFCGPTDLAGSVCICPFLLCSLCLFPNYSQYLGSLLLVVLFCLCLRFFLLVCLTSCFFVFSCCLPPVANIVARAPVGTQIHFSRAPLYLIDPLRSSSPFMGIYAPPILCVSVCCYCTCVFVVMC